MSENILYEVVWDWNLLDDARCCKSWTKYTLITDKWICKTKFHRMEYNSFLDL